MNRYIVRVLRTYHEDWAEVEVEATTKKQAAERAVEMIEADPELFFGDEAEPNYHLDPSLDPEKVI